ncbi:MAG TPA: hypothetical protein VFU29_00650 [Chitinophagaceae bacterium]|nr:hypothetical protein [Chitinophagaceae bacterium]
MRKFTSIVLAFFIYNATAGQDVNLIIQVNENIELGSFTNIHVTLDSSKGSSKYEVDYVPGSLKLSEQVTNLLTHDSTKSIYLFLTYNTYKQNGDHQTATFYVRLTQRQLHQPYLIWSIYDFRDKKYRKWYQTDKKQEFASDLRYPNSGILIRNR